MILLIVNFRQTPFVLVLKQWAWQWHSSDSRDTSCGFSLKNLEYTYILYITHKFTAARTTSVINIDPLTIQVHLSRSVVNVTFGTVNVPSLLQSSISIFFFTFKICRIFYYWFTPFYIYLLRILSLVSLARKNVQYV